MNEKKCPPHRFATRQTTGKETCIDCYEEETYPDLRETDIHTQTAARIFSTAPKNITPDQRRLGGVVNFARLYGSKKTDE